MKFSITDNLKRWEGKGGWFYISSTSDVYAKVRKLPLAKARGFGAIQVTATIGTTSWETSIFPNNEDKNYILFVKKDIRTAESLEVGDSIKATIHLPETEV